MESEGDARTSPSLLGRLRQAPADQAAWNQCVERYGVAIYSWCRHRRLQEADARDVTQDVLLKLSRKMHTFAYDPSRSFRGWLKTLTHHAWRDFVDGRKPDGAGSGDSRVVELLHTVEARDDLARQLEEEFDRELLEMAMARVRLRVQPRTWDAFRLTAVERHSGAEAAAQLHMKVATVFVARSKVQKMLQEEVQRLDRTDAESP
jgi:RNA polymerase sigma factor (sigma-70 family)